jgi:asparagine synthase (glutamine-hydrolysing)
MCGIAGILSLNQNVREESADTIGILLGGIAHRGPDSWGVCSAGRTGILGACRLGITDRFNASADMPFETACGRYVIVFNGEIYNYKELRRELSNHYEFETYSDTEVIVAAYACWGRSCVERFEGMFAFAIYDRVSESCFLAVDPSGQKPLYYMIENDCFSFCSELSPLFSISSSAEIRREALWEVLLLGYSFGRETCFSGIERAQPGEAIIFEKGKLSFYNYYELPLVTITNDPPTDLEETIRQIVESSVAQTISSQPDCALFLSSGLDSTLVLHYLVNAGIAPQTLTARVQSTSYAGEVSSALKVSALYGCNHTAVSANVDSYFSFLDQWFSIMDDPVASRESALIFALCSQLKGKLRVAYTGTGLDELFDGYGNGLEIVQPCHKAEFSTFGMSYLHAFNFLPKTTIDRLGLSSDVFAKPAAKIQETVEKYRGSGLTMSQLCQAVNYRFIGSRYEHHQMDRISLHHEIEIRSPLASKAIADLSVTCGLLDGKAIVNDKAVLRSAFRDVLPRSVIERKKDPFALCPSLWRSEHFKQRVIEVASPSSQINTLGLLDTTALHHSIGFFNPANTELLFRLITIEGYLKSVYARRSRKDLHRPTSTEILQLNRRG